MHRRLGVVGGQSFSETPEPRWSGWDQGQLSAIGAGGMFAALAGDCGGQAAEPTDVRRFVNS
jgi:hypothetical protein